MIALLDGLTTGCSGRSTARPRSIPRVFAVSKAPVLHSPEGRVYAGSSRLWFCIFSTVAADVLSWTGWRPAVPGQLRSCPIF
jgi:hypothetical protein